MSFEVTEKAMRPASTARQCFYCQQPVGANHTDDCVLVVRLVKVRITMEIEIEVPASWDKELIEFARNDGSWCSSNIVRDIERAIDRAENQCICDRTNVEYIDDAGEPFVRESSAEQKSE